MTREKNDIFVNYFIRLIIIGNCLTFIAVKFAAILIIIIITKVNLTVA